MSNTHTHMGALLPKPEASNTARFTNLMEQNIQSLCAQQRSDTQQAVCNYTLENCDRAIFKCGNKAQTRFDCEINTLIDAATKTVADMQADAKGGLLDFLGAASADNNLTVKNSIRQAIEQRCGTEQSINQYVHSTLNCQNSDDVYVKAQNEYDAKTACVMKAVADALIDNKSNMAAKAEGFNPFNSSGQWYVILIIVIVVVIAGGVAIFLFTRSKGGGGGGGGGTASSSALDKALEVAALKAITRGAA